MKAGPGIRRSPKRRAPLRKVVKVISPKESIFDTVHAVLECGHESHGYSEGRQRCLECAPPERLQVAEGETKTGVYRVYLTRIGTHVAEATIGATLKPLQREFALLSEALFWVKGLT